ncbi:hypothetical protein Tco_1286898 [Tanacetum coccineum]
MFVELYSLRPKPPLTLSMNIREGKGNLKDVVAVVSILSVRFSGSFQSDLVETSYLKEVPKANSGRDIVMLDDSVNRDTNAQSTDIIAIQMMKNQHSTDLFNTLDERNLVKEHSFLIFLCVICLR